MIITIFSRVDAINRARIHTGGVLCANAGFSNNERHLLPPSLPYGWLNNLSTSSLEILDCRFPRPNYNEHMDEPALISPAERHVLAYLKLVGPPADRLGRR